MRKIYNALLLLIASATQKELARQVRYLAVENKILRGKADEPEHNWSGGQSWQPTRTHLNSFAIQVEKQFPREWSRR